MASSIIGNPQNLHQATIRQLYFYADQVKATFSNISHELDQKHPDEQIKYINELQHSYHDFPVEILRMLQKTVGDIYQKNVWTPDMSKEGVDNISIMLHDANTSLGLILANKNLAEKISDLFKRVEKNFTGGKTVDAETAEFFQLRITEYKSEPNINQGNSNALEEMLGTICRATGKVGQYQQLGFVDQISPQNVQKSDDQWDPEEQVLLDKLMDLIHSKDPSDQAKLQEIKDLLNNSEVSPTSSHTLPQTRLSPIEELQNLLPFFQEGASLTAAGKRWEEIECGGIESLSTLQSICFHMYYIHKIEAPRMLKNDINYGKNAIIGVHPGTNTDRCRAIMRTIADLTMQELEDAAASDRIEDVKKALKTLENLCMDPKDMPSQQSNLAHTLFGKMYHKHVAARKMDSSLVNPGPDFGRNAFNITAGVNRAVKIEAIKELHNDLKRAWKIII